MQQWIMKRRSLKLIEVSDKLTSNVTCVKTHEILYNFLSTSWLACEKICFSALFTAGMFRMEERLPVSDRNSILMMQTNVYIINLVVVGVQI